jgi:hypothetical protein
MEIMDTVGGAMSIAVIFYYIKNQMILVFIHDEWFLKNWIYMVFALELQEVEGAD